jgi:phage repressor protein C with HTH and peptisase S24 domain
MLSEKLKNLISEEKITQEQFAKSIDMSYERLRNVCQGRVLKLKKEEIDAIELVYGINPQWLVFDKGRKHKTASELQLSAKLEALSTATKTAVVKGKTHKEKRDVQEAEFFTTVAQIQNDQLHKEEMARQFVFVPKFEISASAGGGSIVGDEATVGRVAFMKSLVTQDLGLDPKHVALIDVRGDSMSPTLESGDMLLLDTRRGDTMTDGVYVINLNGALLVKRIRLRLNGDVEVCSDNPKYPTETLSNGAVSTLHVIGRVAWHGGKF